MTEKCTSMKFHEAITIYKKWKAIHNKTIKDFFLKKEGGMRFTSYPSNHGLYHPQKRKKLIKEEENARGGLLNGRQKKLKGEEKKEGGLLYCTPKTHKHYILRNPK